MSKYLRTAIAALFVYALVAAPAGAHGGSPKYVSVYTGTKPAVPGLKVEVLGYDNQYQLVNHTGKNVVVFGYSGEPYGRVLADGTVQVNERSPAYYLNEDRFGTTPVPKSANAKAAPVWKTQSKSGRFTWHDHRMHWMAKTTPKQVTDQHKKTRVFNYAIPISVGARHANVTGTLFWRGTSKGFPVAAIVALVIVLVAAGAFVWAVRRRRASGAPADSGPPAAAAPGKRPKAEAW